MQRYGLQYSEPVFRDHRRALFLDQRDHDEGQQARDEGEIKDGADADMHCVEQSVSMTGLACGVNHGHEESDPGVVALFCIATQ